MYLVDYTHLRINDSYVYPNWAYTLGWTMTLSSVLMVPLWAAGQMCLTAGTFRQVSVQKNFLQLWMPLFLIYDFNLSFISTERCSARWEENEKDSWHSLIQIQKVLLSVPMIKVVCKLTHSSFFLSVCLSFVILLKIQSHREEKWKRMGYMWSWGRLERHLSHIS